MATVLVPAQPDWPPPLHGDALFVGYDECFDDDRDVPKVVLAAARGAVLTGPRIGE